MAAESSPICPKSGKADFLEIRVQQFFTSSDASRGNASTTLSKRSIVKTKWFRKPELNGDRYSMWLHNERLQKLGGGFSERLAIGILAGIHHFMLGAHKDKDVLRLLRRVRKERRSLLTGFEAFNVYSITRSQANLPGDIAEVGVYAGASAS